MKSIVATAISGAGLIAASAASAQGTQMICQPAPPDRQISIGSCFRSSIGPDDPKNDENIAYEDWRLQLRVGESIQIDMEADEAANPPRSPTIDASMPDQPMIGDGGPAFDTYLELRGPGAAIVASNDDRLDSVNSQIRYVATETGEYLVRARPLFDGEGSYSLRITTRPARAEPTPLDARRTVGEFNATSEESEQWSGFRTHRYSFGGTAGERVRIVLRSSGRDKILALHDEEGRPLDFVRGEGEGVQIVAPLPLTGRYVLSVNVAPVEQPTPYVVEFDRSASSVAGAPRRIRIGEDVSAVIGLESRATLDPAGESTLGEIFELAVEAGDLVTVAAESRTFDTVLDAGTLSPIGFAVAQSNDDSGGTRNSLLLLRPVRAGTVHLRVRALGSGSGPFRLTTRRGQSQAAVAAEADYAQLVFIQFAGTITRESIIALNNALHSAGWQVQGSSGERTPNAGGLNEVRYSAEDDRAAAEALASTLTQARLGSAPVSPRRVGVIRPGTLEVWISN